MTSYYAPSVGKVPLDVRLENNAQRLLVIGNAEILKLRKENRHLSTQALEQAHGCARQVAEVAKRDKVIATLKEEISILKQKKHASWAKEVWGEEA